MNAESWESGRELDGLMPITIAHVITEYFNLLRWHRLSISGMNLECPVGM